MNKALYVDLNAEIQFLTMVIRRLVFVNNTRPEHSKSKLIIVPHHSTNDEGEWDLHFGAMVKKRRSEEVVEVEVDKALRITPYCCVMDTLFILDDPDHLDAFYKWKHVMSMMTSMHPQLFDIPCWMVVCESDKEDALFRLEKEVFH